MRRIRAMYQQQGDALGGASAISRPQTPASIRTSGGSTGSAFERIDDALRQIRVGFSEAYAGGAGQFVECVVVPRESSTDHIGGILHELFRHLWIQRVFHAGGGNIVEKNIFVDCPVASSQVWWNDAHWTDYWKTAKQNQPKDIDLGVYLKKYPYVSSVYDASPRINSLLFNKTFRTVETLIVSTVGT